MQPKPGITVLEQGKIKANKQPIKVEGSKKLSLEEYSVLRGEGNSLLALAESRVMGEKSFSLPNLQIKKQMQQQQDSSIINSTINSLDFSTNFLLMGG